MFSLSDILISAAYAQEAVVDLPETSGQSVLMSYLPFILIFAVFYFLVIRPQQKKLSDQDRMVKALQRGDRVVTSGGIHGKIAKTQETGPFLLEIAEGVEIKIDRENIAGLEPKPAAPTAEKGEDKK